MRRFLFALSLFVFCVPAYPQNTDTNISSPTGEINLEHLDTRTLSRLNERYADLGRSIQQRTAKALTSLQRQEADLQHSVAHKDSGKAQLIFAGADKEYKALQSGLQAPPSGDVTSRLKEYIPNIDSLSTALKFLQQKGIPLPADKLQQVQALSAQLQLLQGRLQQANEVQSFIQQREQILKSQLSGLGGGVSSRLLGMNKQVYYYQEQLAQYKETLHDPEKMQTAVLNAVNKVPGFQDFMAKNSFLSRLFPASANYGTPQALAGLQTINDIKQLLQDRFGKAALTPDAAGAGSPLQQQVQAAQAALSKLKDRIASAGGNSTDLTQPDFTPNKQKGKSFLQHFEYGFNIQSQPSTTLLPVTSDIGLNLGYKLNDKATVGVGASYKVGWGSAINNIHITNQGVGLRSYLDIKAKGSFWITGGWEYDYYQVFSKLSDIRNLDIWQKSALIGLTKKYKIGSRNGNIQLLYDVLATRQTPAAPPLRFRVGYSF